jgi:polygalacturonase
VDMDHMPQKDTTSVGNHSLLINSVPSDSYLWVWRSVEDLGVKGDGKTDSIASIKRAISDDNMCVV